MIKQSHIELLEVVSRWISTAATTVLLGLQVTRLIKSPMENSVADNPKE